MEGTTAPAAAPQTTTQQTSSTQETKTSATPQPHAETQGEDKWELADQEAFTKMLAKKAKHDPALKFKHKGVEKPIATEDDLREMIQQAQRGYGANKLVEEVKRKEQELLQKEQYFTQIQQALNSDDVDLQQMALNALGPKAIKAIESVAQKQAREREFLESLSPRERELLQLQEETRRENETLKEYKARIEAQEAEKTRNEIKSKLKTQADGILSKTFESLGLPKDSKKLSSSALRDVAYIMENAMHAGIELTEEQLAEQVKEVFWQQPIDFIHGVPPETVIEKLDKEYVKQLLFAAAKKAGFSPQKSMQQASQQQPKQTTEEDMPQRGTLEYAQWLRRLR